MISRTWKFVAAILFLYSIAAATYAASNANEARDRLLYWNKIAIDSSGLDHTKVKSGETRVFGHQLGPGRSSRAMAIVHIAMFESVNAIFGQYQSYTGLRANASDTSLNAAIAKSAHDTLVSLYPSHKPRLDQILKDDLNKINVSNERKANGISLGKRAATKILALRANDGSAHPEPVVGVDFFPSTELGKWRPDPVTVLPGDTTKAVGALWGKVKPFVLTSGDQFRLPPPPSFDSVDFAIAYDEVKRLGDVNSVERTPDEVETGVFWAYDGTPSLCAPPRLYNQITVTIANQQKTGVIRLARLLALVNVAMADAGVAAWDSKYFYQLARPVTYIREASVNPDLIWVPLGAPASNLAGPNFTPPFPAYPSGHATFGGALFQMLRNFYHTDNIPFTFVSDEFNGVTQDNGGNVRPLKPRSFSSLAQAEEENGQSRIYLGIHWSFDKTGGIAQGREVANFVFNNMFRHREVF